MITERLRKLLSEWSDHVMSDDVKTDEFLTEGMTFDECLQLMDTISKAVKHYIICKQSGANS